MCLRIYFLSFAIIDLNPRVHHRMPTLFNKTCYKIMLYVEIQIFRGDTNSVLKNLKIF